MQRIQAPSSSSYDREIGTLSAVPTEQASSPSFLADVPLIVDLDGTLILTDALHEGLAALLTRRPQAIVPLVSALKGGKASLKSAVTTGHRLDVECLPFREDLVDYLRAEKARGREIHLVTAADQSIADDVAAHLGLFSSAKGSLIGNNLKADTKRDWLVQSFPNGFDYVGDSAHDVSVWRASSHVLLAGGGTRYEAQLARDGHSITRMFADPPVRFKDWALCLRLHQWSKNLIIFVPFILNQQFWSAHDSARIVAAFLSFSLVASATYVFNDISDLASDRRHPRKRRRPIASGTISIGASAMAAAASFAAGMTIGAFLGTPFVVALIGYLCLTVLYTTVLKKEVLVDTLAIGILFTIRVVAGMVVSGQLISMWLSSFACCLFYSLALAKRHGELIVAERNGRSGEAGRGYTSQDLPTTIAFGVSLTLAGVIILILYITFEASLKNLYGNSQWLFVIPVILVSWVGRVWVLAQRGELVEDPVVFALSDPRSWLHAGAVAAVWLLAVL